jgi:hypothetical protein
MPDFLQRSIQETPQQVGIAHQVWIESAGILGEIIIVRYLAQPHRLEIRVDYSDQRLLLLP